MSEGWLINVVLFKVLRRKDREFEHEMEQLAREKIALQQRLAHLKKELSADWDHIDFNALIPDGNFFVFKFLL